MRSKLKTLHGGGEAPSNSARNFWQQNFLPRGRWYPLYGKIRKVVFDLLPLIKYQNVCFSNDYQALVHQFLSSILFANFNCFNLSDLYELMLKDKKTDTCNWPNIQFYVFANFCLLDFIEIIGLCLFLCKC